MKIIEVKAKIKPFSIGKFYLLTIQPDIISADTYVKYYLELNRLLKKMNVSYGVSTGMFSRTYWLFDESVSTVAKLKMGAKVHVPSSYIGGGGEAKFHITNQKDLDVLKSRMIRNVWYKLLMQLEVDMGGLT